MSFYHTSPFQNVLDDALLQCKNEAVEVNKRELEWLLEAATQTTRIQRITGTMAPLPHDWQVIFSAFLKRRLLGEPVQYILGTGAFYGREFQVTSDVLIPRPETELLVEWVMELAPPGGRILDVGTGTGCIAIALARLRPDLDITAVDRSAAALALARENAHALKVNIRLLESDLLAAVAGESFDLIVSNPPYIARDEMLELEPQIRSFEPETALLGGENGAELMARLVPQAFTALRASGRLVLEIGENQTKDVSQLLADAGFGEISVRPDLAGKPRMAHGLKTWPTE